MTGIRERDCPPGIDCKFPTPSRAGPASRLEEEGKVGGGRGGDRNSIFIHSHSGHIHTQHTRAHTHIQDLHARGLCRKKRKNEEGTRATRAIFSWARSSMPSALLLDVGLLQDHLANLVALLLLVRHLLSTHRRRPTWETWISCPVRHVGERQCAGALRISNPGRRGRRCNGHRRWNGVL